MFSVQIRISSAFLWFLEECLGKYWSFFIFVGRLSQFTFSFFFFCWFRLACENFKLLFDMWLETACSFYLIGSFCLTNVGIAIINLLFWDGLHQLFMVFSGVVYYCYTLITVFFLKKNA